MKNTKQTNHSKKLKTSNFFLSCTLVALFTAATLNAQGISTLGDHPDRYLLQTYDGPNSNDSAIFIGYNKDDFSLEGTDLTTVEVDLAIGDYILAGGAKFTETRGWRDFVFDTDYNLPSLVEVEAFIKAKGHLPEVPSEEQIVKQGYYDQHEINMALLQKIEELTLYTIQQQKEIERLKVLTQQK